jgi:hypothetical protein
VCLQLSLFVSSFHAIPVYCHVFAKSITVVINMALTLGATLYITVLFFLFARTRWSHLYVLLSLVIKFISGYHKVGFCGSVELSSLISEP